MLIQRKIEKVMTWVGGVEKQIRPSSPKPTYTFDFQKDGLSGWTASYNSSYAVGGYSSGNGLYGYCRSTSYAQEVNFTMPSTLTGKIKRVVMYVYKPNSSSGIGVSGGNTFMRYAFSRNTSVGIFNGSNEYPYVVGDYNGEVVLDYNLTSSGATGKINSTDFSISTTYANDIVNGFTNKNFKLHIACWYHTSAIYIRKVEIYTE